MALALAPHAPEGVNIDRVIKMLLVHDIVEIDVGDTFAYDAIGHQDKHEKESSAATRIFGLLPNGEGSQMRDLWLEYEAAETLDGAFAHALDRFLPVLHNFRTEGYAWRAHGITRTQVLKRNGVIERGFPALWPVFLSIVESATSQGMLVDA